MNIASFCIRHKVTTIMIYITLAAFGIMSFTSLSLSLLPSMELPMAAVYTTYPSAGPTEVESMVTKPVESAIASISGVDEITSNSAENLSTVMVTFVDGTDMDIATQNMRDKISQIQNNLPDDADSPIIYKMDPDAIPVAVYGLKGADLAQLQSYAKDTLSPRLERIDGVASVDITGGYTKEVQITMDSEKMSGYGMSVSYLSQVLTSENVNIPAGDVDSGSQTLTVRTSGEYASVDELRNTVIPLPKGGSVYLSEIADVRETHQDLESIDKIGDTPCVAISVNKQSGANTVKIANAVDNEMKEIGKDQPNLSYLTVFNQSDYVNQSVHSVMQNIILGIILAVIVLFFFLRDFGATTVIAISMPMCIIVVFLVMHMLNITMNIMSLGGLAMGVGMIVDNSIVVLENIYRYRSDGFTRFDSCVQGTMEMGLAITASTLTTVAVFLPIGFSGGISGMMFKDFVITIATLLGSSLFIALTLVPLLCFILLDRKGERTVMVPREAEKPKPFTLLYQRLLKNFVFHRKRAIIASVIMVVVFIAAIATCDVELMPEMDESMVTISVTMPTGTELEDTAAMSDRIINMVEKSIPKEMESAYYDAEGEKSSITVNLVPIDKRDRSAFKISDELREKLNDFAGAEFSMSTSNSMDMSSSTGSDIDVTIKGDDYDVLTKISNDLTGKIEKLQGAVDVKSSISEQVPQVNITLNRAVAAQYGLNTATVGSLIRTELTGTTSTTLKIDGDEIDVVVKGDKRSAKSLDALKSIPVAVSTGGTVPLSEIANIQVELSPQVIKRDDQERTVTITGSKEDSVDMTDITKGVQNILDSYVMPDGYTVSIGGQSESISDNFTSLAKALIVALFLVYLILASQFESFVLPVMVMMILPAGLLGGLFGLPITGKPISMVTFIGVIMLAGTVVNSSIVLVDYIQTRRRRGEDKNTAILNACPRRVRPVLMTALTTILGLMPMAFGMGESSEMMQPMAIVMIFGMLISTVVTLLFTPVYYSVLDSLVEKVKSRSRKKFKKKLRKQKDKVKTV